MLEQKIVETNSEVIVHKKLRSIKNDSIMAIVFILILMIVPLTYLLSKPAQLSILENRTISQFTAPSFSSFIDKTFQNDLNKAATDQFPLRDSLMLGRSFIVRNCSRIAYAPLKDKAIPSSDTNNVLLWNNGTRSSLIYAPKIYNARVLDIIDKRIQEYDKINEECPDVNINIFDVEMPYYSKFHPLHGTYPNPAGSKYRDYYIDHVKNVNFMVMPITSQEDILKYFYKTDHHWNIFGAWKGYQLIYDMLKTNYPEISEEKQAKSFKKVDGIEAFRGSLARLALYPNIKDDFYDVVLDNIEPYRTLIYGKEDARGLRDKNKEDRKFSDSLFANQYGKYFGSDKGLVEYIFDNKSNRNLLIVGQSYTQAIEYIIASHYSHTYVVDLRHYDDNFEKPFNVTDFIKENKINDILILGEDDVCFSQLETGLFQETREGK